MSFDQFHFNLVDKLMLLLTPTLLDKMAYDETAWKDYTAV